MCIPHKVYTDWLYLWNLSYFGGLSDSIVIILLKLYKWFPVIGVVSERWFALVGVGMFCFAIRRCSFVVHGADRQPPHSRLHFQKSMQMYRFIFLTRKWDSDKHYLARHLSKIARLASDKVQTPGARGAASKLLLLIFPEGTLVSPLTRPISKKFADKSGIEDCKNMLLPRSTGLLFALRTLAADISDLKLVDFTIGYPGVPSPGRAQEFYTLRSTFMQGVGPPAVHMHFTVLSLQPSAANAPPLGTLPATAALAAKDESTPEEHAAFDSWLLNRWRQKDEQMSRFYRDGDFLGGAWHAEHAKSKAGPAFNGPEEMPASEKTAAPVPYIEIPVRLINTTELWHLFWGFYVFAGFYALYRVCVYYHA